MSTFLFSETIFGPIHSRRLGSSLGVNLLPVSRKYCNFNCVYCECGANTPGGSITLPSRYEVKDALLQKLAQLHADNQPVDSITFAGNGEPTIHPDFAGIIDDVINLRSRFYPNAKVSVLSNATMINNQQVVEALKKVDMNILKLDSALDATVKAVNRPTAHYTVSDTVNLLKQFNGKFILQTMFFEGDVNGLHINNMAENELSAWLKIVDELRPQTVMIYTIDRDTPEKTLRKATHQELENIKNKISELGVNVQVSE